MMCGARCGRKGEGVVNRLQQHKNPTMLPADEHHLESKCMKRGGSRQQVGVMTQFSFLPNSANSRSEQRQAPGGQNDPILVFTEQCKTHECGATVRKKSDDHSQFYRTESCRSRF
jgi:hypothetical protein